MIAFYSYVLEPTFQNFENWTKKSGFEMVKCKMGIPKVQKHSKSKPFVFEPTFDHSELQHLLVLFLGSRCLFRGVLKTFLFVTF